ncbi:DUF3000 domain-containing protein [Arcanobacterium hippocoleae]|uniref:DUF3000 domain-containing protein n=1 Tax=Arcanobacterium hippocoleae TaxID=149017 RepID=A0ABU1T0E3_9ACTO|nr:DUF3000 domain-containing protein [Arcanobacterium hippocoleae]MDR6938834.1 hypothetical protein [Arcanobacterium hippocoleae]
MVTAENHPDAPPQDFVTALDSLKGHTFRPEFHLTQIPAPTRIAPWAVALQAEVNESQVKDPECYRGETKFVVLHDPAGQTAWNGDFRIILHARAPMDHEMGDDPLLGEVAWSWLHDSLLDLHASFHSLNGTVTRVFNETFGGLMLNTARVELEVRASWTPSTPYLGEHLLAWAHFAERLSGLPPEGAKIAALPRRLERI